MRTILQLSQRSILRSILSRVTTFAIKQLRFFKTIALIAVFLGSSSLMSGTAWATNNKVLIGSKQGELVFEPSTITIKPGDTIKWVNNLTHESSCNVVFDNVVFKNYPTVADENQLLDNQLFDYLSHKNLLKTPQEEFEKEFNVSPGEYTYTCTPHQSAGMIGKVIVAEG